MIGRQFDWETLWIVIFIMGMIVSLMMGSAVMYYGIACMIGIMLGRFAYKSRGNLQFQQVMIAIMFILGFIAGNLFTGYGDAAITVGIYLLGMIISTMVHEKGVIDAIDY